jgi:hypothetical protein
VSAGSCGLRRGMYGRIARCCPILLKTPTHFCHSGALSLRIRGQSAAACANSRASATGVCGLELLVYEALSY